MDYKVNLSKDIFSRGKDFKISLDNGINLGACLEKGFKLYPEEFETLSRGQSAEDGFISYQTSGRKYQTIMIIEPGGG